MIHKIILKKYRKIRENYFKKIPYEKWLVVRSVSIKTLGLFGLHVSDPNFKVTLLFAFPLIFCLFCHFFLYHICISK